MLVKSPVCASRETLIKWLQENFFRADPGSLHLPRNYPCVMVATKNERGEYEGSEVVYYHEFQSARYEVVKDG